MNLQEVMAAKRHADKIRKNRFIAKFVGAALIVAGLGIAIAILTGCGAEFVHTAIDGTDDCEPETIMCENDVWAICNADRKWELINECKDFEPGVWMCCEFGGNVGCHKEEDCL